MVSCYSLNSITSSHLSHAFSYSPVYAGAIGGGVSAGIAVIVAFVGGGTTVIVVVVKRRNKKKKEVGGSGLNHTLQCVNTHTHIHTQHTIAQHTHMAHTKHTKHTHTHNTRTRHTHNTCTHTQHTLCVHIVRIHTNCSLYYSYDSFIYFSLYLHAFCACSC